MCVGGEAVQKENRIILDGTNKGWSLTAKERPWGEILPSNAPVCPREGGMFPLEPDWKRNEDVLQCKLNPYKAADALSKTLSHKSPGML